MNKVFKTLTSHKIEELVPYIKEYVSQHPNLEILVGCDSQNRKRETIYAIVIGLYTPGKGAHVLYSKFIDIFKDKKINIKFISASKKLLAYDGPFIECKLKSPYAQRKWCAVQYTKYFLGHSLAM